MAVSVSGSFIQLKKGGASQFVGMFYYVCFPINQRPLRLSRKWYTSWWSRSHQVRI